MLWLQSVNIFIELPLFMSFLNHCPNIRSNSFHAIFPLLDGNLILGLGGLEPGDELEAHSRLVGILLRDTRRFICLLTCGSMLFTQPTILPWIFNPLLI